MLGFSTMLAGSSQLTNSLHRPTRVASRVISNTAEAAMAWGVMRSSDTGRFDVEAISAIGCSLPEAEGHGRSEGRTTSSHYRNRRNDNLIGQTYNECLPRRYDFRSDGPKRPPG